MLIMGIMEHIFASEVVFSMTIGTTRGEADLARDDADLERDDRGHRRDVTSRSCRFDRRLLLFPHIHPR